MKLKLQRSPENAAFKVFDSIGSVADVVDVQLPAYGKRVAIRYDDGNDYRAQDFATYLDRIKRMIRFFQAAETGRQRVVATFCKNRPEWDMTALATFYTGNILFPLDTKMNADELRHLLAMNPPDDMLVPRVQLARVRSLMDELGLATRLLVADVHRTFEDTEVEALDVLEGEVEAIDGQGGNAKPLPLRDREVSLGRTIEQFEPIGDFRASDRLDDKATVLGHYATSGTTSLPKIVQITHGNMISEVNEAIDVLNLRVNEEMLNIGPYTHIATLVEFLVTKTRGFPVAYFTREPDDDDVLEDEIKKLKRQGVRIKALLAVPKFWIYLLKEVLEEMKNKPVLHNLYRHLLSIEKNARLYDIGTLDKAKLSAVRMLLRNKLGGYFSYGISSSTRLDGALVDIFGKLGVTVIDIYGATEASGIISRNKLNDVHPGTCGRMISLLDYRIVNREPIPGIEHPVGELQIKGPTLSAGYLGTPPGSHLDADGFYATGDLAWVDDDRIVHLVGRRKELIRWDDGSYIDPMHLSNLLVRSIFVKDALVTRLREEDNFLSVFIYPDYKRIENDPGWQVALRTGVSRDLALRHRLGEAIDYAHSIARISAPLDKEKIYLLPQKLQRTPTHKIKLIWELARLDTGNYI